MAADLMTKLSLPETDFHLKNFLSFIQNIGLTTSQEVVGNCGPLAEYLKAFLRLFDGTILHLGQQSIRDVSPGAVYSLSAVNPSLSCKFVAAVDQ